MDGLRKNLSLTAQTTTPMAMLMPLQVMCMTRCTIENAQLRVRKAMERMGTSASDWPCLDVAHTHTQRLVHKHTDRYGETVKQEEENFSLSLSLYHSLCVSCIAGSFSATRLFSCCSESTTIAKLSVLDFVGWCCCCRFGLCLCECVRPCARSYKYAAHYPCPSVCLSVRQCVLVDVAFAVQFHCE